MFVILFGMKGATQGGFTIVEVMMVLAVSATLLISAISVFNGKREDTFFSQGVYDLRSELQSLANNVSSQTVPGLQSYKCTATNTSGTMQPVLTPGTQTGQDCIYLGQAIQVAPNSTTLYSYPVFGLRTVYSGVVDTGAAPQKLSDANPTPITIANLTTTYGLLNGLKVVSAKFNGTENDILTLYSNLQDSNTSGNEIDVSSQAYTGTSTVPATQVTECVQNGSCTPLYTTSTIFPGNQVTATPWNLCVQYASRQAEISLKSTPTGIVTQINMNGCP